MDATGKYVYSEKKMDYIIPHLFFSVKNLFYFIQISTTDIPPFIITEFYSDDFIFILV
jgi:hypothetical protein